MWETYGHLNCVIYIIFVYDIYFQLFGCNVVGVRYTSTQQNAIFHVALLNEAP